MSSRAILRWSDCDLSESSFLPPPPDFFNEASQDFVTSTQISSGSYSPDLADSPPKKKACHKKFTKQEALDLMSGATNHADAAQNILELLAERTFSNISGQDLEDIARAQDNLRRKLDRLSTEVSTRKFRHQKTKVISKNIVHLLIKKFKDPNILDVTFCKKDDYSVLENFEKEKECKTSENCLQIERTQTQPSQPISGLQYRKKLSDLKDWDRVMSRSKTSYEAVQLDAIKQVEITFDIHV